MNEEIYESSVRSRGDLGAFCECDKETFYFYLLDNLREEGHRIVDQINVACGDTGLKSGDVSIEWSSDESRVGLFIKRELWAAFDVRTGRKFGDNYRPGGKPGIPPELHFAMRGDLPPGE